MAPADRWFHGGSGHEEERGVPCQEGEEGNPPLVHHPCGGGILKDGRGSDGGSVGLVGGRGSERSLSLMYQ